MLSFLFSFISSFQGACGRPSVRVSMVLVTRVCPSTRRIEITTRDASHFWPSFALDGPRDGPTGGRRPDAVGAVHAGRWSPPSDLARRRQFNICNFKNNSNNVHVTSILCDQFHPLALSVDLGGFFSPVMGF